MIAAKRAVSSRRSGTCGIGRTAMSTCSARERLLDDRRAAGGHGLLGPIAHDRERRRPCLDHDRSAIVRGDRVLAR